MNALKRILIVDDEPNVRLVFRTALDSPGYEIAVAEEGVSALALLRDRPADLVLLDLQMPVMGGMEVLAQLREAGNDVPVVIVTAHGDIPNAVHAMKLGAIDFLAKPLTPEALRRVVAEVLERQALPQEAPSARGAADDDGPVTAGVQFRTNLARAKRALNRRFFDEADVFLKQAVALDPRSAEAHNLMGVLHECRNEHDASYRSYRAALRADRHYEPARHNMRRYYERYTFGATTLPIDLGVGD